MVQITFIPLDRVASGDVRLHTPGLRVSGDTLSLAIPKRGAVQARQVEKPVPFGKYLLLERINVGGMAEVFKAKAFGVEGFERIVAVKRILPSISEDEDFTTMFIDEAKIAVQLTHTNIVQVFDLGKVDNAYFIAMEYVFGKDLRAIFDYARRTDQSIALPMACFITMKVCEALDYAHKKKDSSGSDLHVVHRDVSPQNVLISFEGDVKVADFGIAKATGRAGVTKTGILKGKFGYMSPEQVRGLPVDARSDVFAVGICLYELVTGQRLFSGDSDFSTLEKVRNVEVEAPTLHNPSIPKSLERIIMKALGADPSDRHQTSMDLHDELQAFLYTTGNLFGRRDLSRYMHERFEREYQESKQRDQLWDQYGSSGDTEPELELVDDLAPTEPEKAESALARTSSLKPNKPLAKTAPALRGVPKGASFADADDWPTIPEQRRPKVTKGKRPSPFDPEVTAESPRGRRRTKSEARKRPRARQGPLRGLSPWWLLAPLAVVAVAGVWLSLLLFRPDPGTIQFSTTPPDTTVFFDEEQVPVLSSPFVIPDVSPGTVHLIEVRRVGYVPWSMQVKVRPNQVLRLPRVVLERSGGGVPGDSGTVILDTDPAGAVVWIDGVIQPQRTPVNIPGLQPGEHAIRVERGWFYSPWQTRVKVEAGEVLRLPKAVLSPRQVTLSVTSRPSGAVVHLIQGQTRRRIGVTPVSVPMRSEGWTLELRKGGFQTWSGVVPAPAHDGTIQVGVELRPSGLAVGEDQDSKPPDAQPTGVAVQGPQADPVAQGQPPQQDDDADRKKTSPPPTSGKGTLRINTTPWTQVYVDGQLVGNTPQMGIQLKAGTHRVTLVNNDFEIRKTMNIRITAGKTVTRILDLQ